MGPDMLQPVHIAHDGLRKISQIPLSEIAKGQLPETLDQSDADRFDFAVDQTVCGLILLHMRYERQSQECQNQKNEGACFRQTRPIRQDSHVL